MHSFRDFERQTTAEELLRKIADEYPKISKAGCLARKPLFRLTASFFSLYLVRRCRRQS
jgi:hypothetical protein